MMRATRLLLACGVVGPLLFIVVFLVEGATRPGYSAWRHYVSQLSLSDQGWEQIANFLICGTLCIAFAVGLRRVWPTGTSSVAAPLFMGLFGLALIVAGVFVTDPGLGYPPGTPLTGGAQTWHGRIHGINGLVVFVFVLPGACFALARRFGQDRTSRSWATWSWIVGAMVVVLFVGATASSVLVERGIADTPTGLIQRLELILGWTWVAGSALRLMRQT